MAQVYQTGEVILLWTLSLIFGRIPGEVPKKDFPNQGIWLSTQNALWTGAQGAVIGGVFGLLVAEGPVSWLIFSLIGLLICFLAYGGYAWLSHLSMRLVLVLNKCIPQDYVHFLNYADKRGLIQKVGGSYAFTHQILRDHFAKSESLMENKIVPINISSFTTSATIKPSRFLWLKSAGWIVILAIFVITVRLLMFPMMPIQKVYDLRIEPGNNYTGYIQSSKLVKDHMTVSVQAEGIISMDTYRHNVDPDGYVRGFMGLPLSAPTNRKRHGGENFPRGALLCKITSEPNWRKCGSGLTFTADSDGYLEFMINRTDSETHRGFFGIYIQG
ncbi:MAG: hypothetical protein M3R61_04890, partial [Chloroflexota bacterium]|nr:hypothetical protein [Chloroflexota bacterium]